MSEDVAADVERPVPADETSEAVKDTAEVLADARQILADAEADHAAALAAHEAAKAGPPPVLGQQIVLEGGAVVDLPGEFSGVQPRRLQIGDHNYEHVSDTAEGVWVYRRM